MWPQAPLNSKLLHAAVALHTQMSSAASKCTKLLQRQSDRQRASVLTALCLLQTPNGPLIASVCIITAGTALAGYGEVNASILGMIIQFVSESAEAGRLIMTQTLLQGLSFNPIEGLMYLAPASLAWMAVFAALFEAPRILSDNGMAIVAANPGLFLLAASLGFAVSALSFFTIQLCGSLTLKVRPCITSSCFTGARM